MFEIYKNKRVFLTGHTGFKGAYLATWLTCLGANVCGYSLAPNTEPSLFNAINLQGKIEKSVIGDILDVETLSSTLKGFQPDIVFHLAAQPLVRLSYAQPLLTYQTNVIGSLNVLQAARECESVKAFVNVTTDKYYENKEIRKGYTEDDAMGGHDMYSSSKACVEILSSSFRRSFLENSYLLATARAGNVIGGGDWALDRLIPDCVRCIENNLDIELRNPDAIRPWQHVLEPLSGYLTLGARLLEGQREFAQAFNFGPEESNALTVIEMAKKLCEIYGKGKVIVNKTESVHEAGILMLDITKAKAELGWSPVYNADKALEKTAQWYKHFYDKDVDMFEFTLSQIKEYESEMVKL